MISKLRVRIFIFRKSENHSDLFYWKLLQQKLHQHTYLLFDKKYLTESSQNRVVCSIKARFYIDLLVKHELESLILPKLCTESKRNSRKHIRQTFREQIIWILSCLIIHCLLVSYTVRYRVTCQCQPQEISHTPLGETAHICISIRSDKAI